MSQKQSQYITEEADKLAEAGYVSDAVEMMGAGYEQPAAVIDPPRTLKALRVGGLAEYKAWGWVKMSAKFIAHLRQLKGAKLAIWQCIALSIDETGTCKMTLKQIGALTGYSHTEVIESLKELELAGYMDINKDRKTNIYKPVFVARGESQSPKETLVKKLDSSTADSNESSPAIENSSPSISRVKDFNNVNERFALLRKLYTENIGAMVPLMIDMLRNAAINYPDSTWYSAAFEVAVTKNARNWKYVETVLENWKNNGRGWSPSVDTTKQRVKPNRRQSEEKADQYDYDALRAQVAEAEAKRQAAQ